MFRKVGVEAAIQMEIRMQADVEICLMTNSVIQWIACASQLSVKSLFNMLSSTL